ncbi:unnamed protein product [Meganyctiphanes norvegica]|uniref:RING-CH-type domain-containing protein n=1 Tax=Meganyctiphanes norvegica TaxID=48144 RepID=A0AAV2PQH3_MEGNR
MAQPRSQHASIDSTAVLLQQQTEERLPNLHPAQVNLQSKEEEDRLQIPTAAQDKSNLDRVHIKTANDLPQEVHEIPTPTHKQKAGKQDEKHHINSNKKYIQFNKDVRFEKEVKFLHCKDRGREKQETLKIGNNKNISIVNINDSECELDDLNVENSDIYSKLATFDKTNHNITYLSNDNTLDITNHIKENLVNCDKNNNSENKDDNINETVNNRKISDVVILINDEQCGEKEIDSKTKHIYLKKPENHLFNKYRLQPPLNKVASVPTLRIVPPLNKINSAPDLRISPHFTDYKNSYLQRHEISELTLKKDSPRESINTKNPAKKISIEFVKMVKSNCCIFCGEGSQLEGTGQGQLIPFCQCTASAHDKCIMRYLTFPSTYHDRCCVCRSKLQYTVDDQETPMQIKYAVILVLISVAYISLVLFSIRLTQVLIPMGDIHEFLYLLIIGNVGFIPPAIIVFIISVLLSFMRPKPKLGESGETSWIQGDVSSWFWCNSEECEEKGCGGDTFGVILAAFCLLSVMVVIICASIYIVYNVYLYYKSFKLKSKKSIRFSCEKNTKNNCTV